MGALEQTDACLLRQYLCDSRAEAESLRFDLGDANALIEALEGELWSVTTRWSGNARDQRHPGSDVLGVVTQARTLVRRRLFQELGPNGIQPAALADLRLAEAAFSFLLSLRSLRAGRCST